MVKKMQSYTESHSALGNLLYQTKLLLRSFPYYKIQHVPRIGNEVIDMLAQTCMEC